MHACMHTCVCVSMLYVEYAYARLCMSLHHIVVYSTIRCREILRTSQYRNLTYVVRSMQYLRMISQYPADEQFGNTLFVFIVYAYFAIRLLYVQCDMYAIKLIPLTVMSIYGIYAYKYDYRMGYTCTNMCICAFPSSSSIYIHFGCTVFGGHLVGHTY